MPFGASLDLLDRFLLGNPALQNHAVGNVVQNWNDAPMNGPDSAASSLIPLLS